MLITLTWFTLMCDLNFMLCVILAAFSPHGSIPIFFSHVAQTGYDTCKCKEGKSTWIPTILVSSHIRLPFKIGHSCQCESYIIEKVGL